MLQFQEKYVTISDNIRPFVAKKGIIMAKIAILGFGVVGSGAAEVITHNLELIEKRIGQELTIKYILDLRDFPESPFGHLVIHDFDTIVHDPDVSIVAEMMGGSHPAFEFSMACLKAGKSVVTSNKEVVANFGAELLKTAKEMGVRYLFEASVGGGIPVIRPIVNDLAANSIRSVSGILNGTTNYILTQMETSDADFADALAAAQKKGYAEADPTADIEGMDAARKIVILAALAFGKLLDPNKIYAEGITTLSRTDMKVARALGYTIKLIAHSEKIDGKILAMVSPRLVPMSNPLHSISDVFNGIMLDTDMLGQAMFYGKGAGKLPTASAVVADIIDIAKSPEYDKSFPVLVGVQENEVADIDDYSCPWLLVLKNEIALGVKTRTSATVDGNYAVITEEIREADMRALRITLGETLVSAIRIL